jgi:DNA-3-methyladenine glycosylase II
MIQILDEKVLHDATLWLAKRDSAMERVYRQYGFPPLWARKPQFSTLVHIILEQQVSLASANAAFQRLQNHLGAISPEAFVRLDDQTLREIGFSRQKTRYTQGLALEILEARLDLEALASLSDTAVRQRLKQLTGIGDWTADIYLSECLLRPDILPKGDIAMQEAFRVLKGLAERPVHDDFVKQTLHWRPWRSVGSRMLWHFYLCERQQSSKSEK